MPPKKRKAVNEDVLLSLTKLHRVLRPLRTKTLALAEVLNQPSVKLALGGAVQRTREEPEKVRMQSSSSPAPRYLPQSSPEPLRVKRVGSDLHQYSVPFDQLNYGPEQLGSQFTNNQDAPLSAAISLGIAHARVGDKTAAVVTAFELVLKHIYPSKPPSSRVPSLRSLCGAIVGSQIEPPPEEDDSFDDDEDEEEEDSSEVVDQWYEAIPEHLRRFVVTSHAIDMVETILPMSLPRLWETLMGVASEVGSQVEVRAILLKLMDISLGKTSKPVPSTDQHPPPTYLVKLLERYTSMEDLQTSRASFISLLIQAIIVPDYTVHWAHSGIQNLLETEEDPFVVIKVFDAMLSSDTGTQSKSRLRRWSTRILRLDFALPPDEEMEDAALWVDALCICTLRVLKRSIDDRPHWRSAALCLGLHAYVRSEDHPCRPDILDNLHTLSLLCCEPSTKSSTSTFAILLPCLDRHYFFDAVHEYANAMWQTGRLKELESMFLSSALSFAQRCAEPAEWDSDPEPILDNDQTQEIGQWLDRARSACRAKSRISDAGKDTVSTRRSTIPGSLGVVQSRSLAPEDSVTVSAPLWPPPATHIFHEPADSSSLRPIKQTKPLKRKRYTVEVIIPPFLPRLVARSAPVPRVRMPTSPAGVTASSSSEASFSSPERHQKRTKRDASFATSRASYAQPPSWVTDPQTLLDAAGQTSEYRRRSNVGQDRLGPSPIPAQRSPAAMEVDYDRDHDDEEEIDAVPDMSPLTLHSRSRSSMMPRHMPYTGASRPLQEHVNTASRGPAQPSRTQSALQLTPTRPPKRSYLTARAVPGRIEPRARPNQTTHPRRSVQTPMRPPQPSHTRHIMTSGPDPLDVFTPPNRPPHPSQSRYVMSSGPDPLDVFTPRPSKKPRLAGGNNHKTAY